MSHFAQVTDGVVTQVIVADQDVIDSGAFGDGWIQTSYNTNAGQHNQGGTPLRKNYAAVGCIYDAVRDAFYSQKPYPSWVLDEASCVWFPPVPYPVDQGFFDWDEPTQAWIARVLE